MRQRRSCDRCYQIKARCVSDDTSKSCTRCHRLGHSCVGRQTLPDDIETPTSAIDEAIGDASTSTVLVRTIQSAQLNRQPSPWPQNLTQDERVYVDFLLHPAQIAGLLYGLTFRDSMRSAMAGPFFMATDQLKDGYVALASVLLETKDTGMKPSAQIQHTWRGSKALQVLRSLKSPSMQDARIALSLALVLVTYNDLNVGGPTLPIARSALLQAEPFWRRLSQSGTQETDPHLICLLFCEIFECLVVGQIPVFRYEDDARMRGLDRYYGICHDLLPCLYDICVLHKSIKERLLSDRQLGLKMQRLSSVVAQWNPATELTERATAVQDHSERQHFLLQAKSFKYATELLLIQTQRSPGMDLLARAKAIQLEEQIIQARHCGAGKPKYLLFPYFLACVELYGTQEGCCEKVLSAMHDVSNGNAPKTCETMVGLLEHIWRSKQHHPDLTWFQCVDEKLQISMGP